MTPGQNTRCEVQQFAHATAFILSHSSGGVSDRTPQNLDTHVIPMLVL